MTVVQPKEKENRKKIKPVHRVFPRLSRSCSSPMDCLIWNFPVLRESKTLYQCHSTDYVYYAELLKNHYCPANPFEITGLIESIWASWKIASYSLQKKLLHDLQAEGSWGRIQAQSKAQAVLTHYGQSRHVPYRPTSFHSNEKHQLKKA